MVFHLSGCGEVFRIPDLKQQKPGEFASLTRNPKRYNWVNYDQVIYLYGSYFTTRNYENYIYLCKVFIQRCDKNTEQSNDHPQTAFTNGIYRRRRSNCCIVLTKYLLQWFYLFFWRLSKYSKDVLPLQLWQAVWHHRRHRIHVLWISTSVMP